ncbi:MAG: Maf family protein [Alphaproteobacteria bacterium]
MAAQLILGSNSPRRKELLEQIHITADKIIAADIDEAVLKNELPRIYAQRMAQSKCQAVQQNHPNDFILSADTIVCMGRRVLGKPQDASQAQQFLQALSGRSHRVYTAVSLYSPQTQVFHHRLCESRVIFHRLDSNDINYYIASNEWQGKAGAYAIQGYGGRFIRKIIGSYTNIVGLPCDICYNLLKGSGYPPLQGKLL